MPLALQAPGRPVQAKTREPGDLPLIVMACQEQRPDTATGRRGERHADKRQVHSSIASRFRPRPSFSRPNRHLPVAH